MKVVRIEVSQFMNIRQMAFTLKSKGLTQITGKSGAGKSCLLRFIEWALMGPRIFDKKKLKGKVVRNGEDKAWGQLDLVDEKLGHFILTRSVTTGGTHDFTVIDQATGKMVPNKQKWLDEMVTGFSFDPLKFAQMDTDAQIEELKKLMVVDVDFDAHEKADKEDERARRDAESEVKVFKAQMSAIDPEDLAAELPKKIDETAIFQKLSKAQELTNARNELGADVARIGTQKNKAHYLVTGKEDDIAQLEKQLAAARQELIEFKKNEKDITAQHSEAEKKFQKAPVVDVDAVTTELKKAQASNQRTNKLIELHAQADKLNKDIEAREKASAAADERIKKRERMRNEAFAAAKLPVPKLTFDKTQVYYDGVALAFCSQGEQIQISTLLGIHMHPKMEIMCIQQGEALDEDGLTLIEKMAIENNFQVVMARLETSGNVGIVVDDGRIKKVNP
jgi:DNA repair exonuclease SbcCD ATPase subunit